MRLVYIKFSNFRQFDGDQVLEFAHKDRGDCTLIVGQNGAGKTTILNAVTWILYRETTPDFQSPEALMSHRSFDVLSEGETGLARAGLCFIHDGKRYEVTRTANIKKVAGDQRITSTSIAMSFIDETGGSQLVHEPDQFISQLFPHDLASFFFFNGEQLGKLAADFRPAGKAIKSVLRLTRYERALSHLPRAHQVLLDLLKTDTSAEIEALIAERRQCVDVQDEKSRELKDILANKSSNRARLEVVKTELGQHAASRVLQSRRKASETELGIQRQQLINLYSDLKKVINQSGALVFLLPLSETVLQRSHELRERGQLPAAIKTQFIDDLLEVKRCICGSELEPGSSEYLRVSEWRLKAGHAESEENWQRAAAFAGHVRHEADALSDTNLELRRRIGEVREEIKRLEEEISAISGQLSKIDDRAVEALVREQNELERIFEDLLVKEGGYESKIADAIERVAKIDAQVALLKKTNAEIRAVQEKIDVLQAAKTALDLMYSIRLESIRADLEESLNVQYRNVAVHQYQVRVSSSFEISVVHEVNGKEMKAAMSTAETLSLYMCFVASLSALNWTLKKRDEHLGGGSFESFPVMMDAAVGQLDGHYMQALRSLPDLNHQVIFLNFDEQATKIQEQLGSKIRKVVALINRTDRQEFNESSAPTFSVDGVTRRLVEKSERFNETKILNGQI